ncbi:MAG: hypothetical protein ABH826_04205, partial [Patescibacteria group bacterium]|nr:hypothetical protein [Patescibacteria group bacterium]
MSKKRLFRCGSSNAIYGMMVLAVMLAVSSILVAALSEPEVPGEVAMLDIDADGVVDMLDSCTATGAGEVVNDYGCSNNDNGFVD